MFVTSHIIPVNTRPVKITANYCIQLTFCSPDIVQSVRIFLGVACAIITSGVSRISFRWGGSKYFWKSGGICMALRAWQSHAFASGVRGHAPPSKFLKMVHLENIMLKFCKIKIVKIFIFFI